LRVETCRSGDVLLSAAADSGLSRHMALLPLSAASAAAGSDSGAA
jgi:hypothetical protein